MSNKNREQWNSTIGFVLAAAGSAVGLGNLWKFPYVVGKNGGGAFVIIYLILLFTVGVSLVLGEIAIGRATQKNTYGAYRAINKKFGFAGILGVITVFIIACFYSTIGGWVVKYLITYMTTGIHSDTKSYFDAFTASTGQTILFQYIFIGITALIVSFGVQRGIEKISKFMMPALFVLLIVLVIRALTLPNAMAGVRFLLKPDFTAVTMHTVLAALGQVFFSLSVGQGTLITYGSYINKKENIEKTAFYIPFIDTIIAILGGLVVMPAVFSFGFAPAEGPGLAFVTIPAIFESMPMGRIFGILFFILLFFASVTSSISMFEMVIAYLVEERRMSRKTATVWFSAAVAVISIPCALSTGMLSDLHIFGKTVFDLFDFTASNILMPLGGIIMCIFIGYAWKTKHAVREISNDGTLTFRLRWIWSVIIKYVAPVIIFVVLLSAVGIL